MTYEGILWKSLGQSVSDLSICGYRKDLDETFADMLSKMVVAHVDVLGAGTKLWKPG
jgi:hypothetical protein